LFGQIVELEDLAFSAELLDDIWSNEQRYGTGEARMGNPGSSIRAPSHASFGYFKRRSMVSWPG